MTTEKPDLQNAEIADCLLHHYGLPVVKVAFMPRGGDLNSAVYRVFTSDELSYFLKLRRGVFDDTSVTVPSFLHNQGIRQIIAPIATSSHQLWGHLNDFHVILYPFVEGHNAFEVALTEHQWTDFGKALKGIHTAVVPAELSNHVQRETYSPKWRETVKMLLRRARNDTFDDPIAAQLAQIIKARAEEILYLVRRAEYLGLALQAQDPEFVLCHSDIHAGNILIDTNGNLHIVDWDNPILAPKERDLMFVGGGIGGIWHLPAEEALFYKGYGQTPINPVALSYYRFERIV